MVENPRERHKVTGKVIADFEARFDIPFDAVRRAPKGLDAVVNKEHSLRELIYALRMNSAKFTPYLVGPSGVGKKFTLKAIFDEVNEFRSTGETLTKNPGLVEQVKALSASLPQTMMQTVTVYDFPYHNTKPLQFALHSEARAFCDDVMIFYDALTERWKQKLLEVPRSSRHYQSEAKQELRKRVSRTYKRLKFKLVAEGKELDIEFDTAHPYTRAFADEHPEEAKQLHTEFFMGPFKGYLEQYRKDITPENISKKSSNARETMVKNLIKEENVLRSRLKMRRISRADEKTLRSRLNLYPTSEESLVGLYGAILKEKYETAKDASEWISELVDFLAQRQIRKVLDGQEPYEVNLGGRELTLDEVVRPKFQYQEKNGSLLLQKSVADPTMEVLFGRVSSDKYTAPQHSIELGVFATHGLVNLEFVKGILESPELLSKIRGFINEKKYRISDGTVSIEIPSPCIVTFSGLGNEFDDHPIMQDRLERIVFDKKTIVSRASCEAFCDALHLTTSEYNQRNKKDPLRPLVKSGISAGIRLARAHTGYVEYLSNELGLFAKEFQAIAKRLEGDKSVTDADVIKYFAERREHDAAARHKRWKYILTYHAFPRQQEMGFSVGAAVYEGTPGVLFSGYGVPEPINVTVSSGKGKVISSGKGKLEGELMEKGHMNAHIYLTSLLKDKNLDLTINYAFESEESDGWSASMPIVLTAVSALVKKPIDQRIASTGFIADTNGMAGWIGGVQEKTYGWYRTAREMCERYVQPFEGYGMLIPENNLDELLMFLPFYPDLKRDVESGVFSIYTMRSVEDGLDVLLNDDGHKALQLAKGVYQKNRNP